MAFAKCCVSSCRREISVGCDDENFSSPKECFFSSSEESRRVHRREISRNTRNDRINKAAYQWVGCFIIVFAMTIANNAILRLFVVEIAKLAMDVELLLVASLYATYDLSVDTEALADLDDSLCLVSREVDLHAVTHVEHLVHL